MQGQFNGLKAMVTGVPPTVESASTMEEEETSMEVSSPEVAVGEETEEGIWQKMQSGVSQELDACCALTFKQRLLGFLICACIGFLLSLGSFLRIAKALAGNCRLLISHTTTLT